MLKSQEFEQLKADIGNGLWDVAEGRVKTFDKKRIVEREKKLLKGRSP